MLVAFLVDGSFFLKRHRAVFPGERSPEGVARNLERMCYDHIRRFNNKCDARKGDPMELYRIFFYDCEPYAKKHHNPVSKRCINFDQSKEALFRRAFFEALRKKRKVALRMGQIQCSNGWTLSNSCTRNLLRSKKTLAELREHDVRLDLEQKGVDIKIGIDIASLAYKQTVQKIVLISGDSDFVPAAKLARREGIDFVLDPMWNPIRPNLHEHIDGLFSACPPPSRARNHLSLVHH